ncbi:uncharacterized protein LOC144951764 isoform X2 [Lampetra fluviatilis]
MLKLSAREVRSHRSLDSCWVVRDGRVFDVTRFVRMHPGGETALLRRAGADVGRAMRGAPHKHSHNAYRWLEQYCIGELAEGEDDDGDGGEEPQQVQELEPAVTESNGVSSEQSGLEPDTSTDIEVTYKTVSTENDLVDWSKPLLWQVGHLREKYDEWVHQPVDRHIRLFGSDLVESWTKTSWRERDRGAGVVPLPLPPGHVHLVLCGVQPPPLPLPHDAARQQLLPHHAALPAARAAPQVPVRRLPPRLPPAAGVPLRGALLHRLPPGAAERRYGLADGGRPGGLRDLRPDALLPALRSAAPRHLPLPPQGLPRQAPLRAPEARLWDHEQALGLPLPDAHPQGDV